jgi:hypothetical protein
VYINRAEQPRKEKIEGVRTRRSISFPVDLVTRQPAPPLFAPLPRSPPAVPPAPDLCYHCCPLLLCPYSSGPMSVIALLFLTRGKGVALGRWHEYLYPLPSVAFFRTPPPPPPLFFLLLTISFRYPFPQRSPDPHLLIDDQFTSRSASPRAAAAGGGWPASSSPAAAPAALARS